MLKKILKVLKHIFCLKCPDCGGEMDNVDVHHDSLVYRCEKCGKEWI